MTLYLDTEFNGHGGELISLALVSDRGDGSSFYGVWPLPSQVHPWVAEHVIPKLDSTSEPVDVLRMRLQHYLEKHQGEDIVADWPDDFAHLMRAMSGDAYERSFMVECTLVLVNSGEVRPELPHNALSDAVALMHWHKLAKAAA